MTRWWCTQTSRWCALGHVASEFIACSHLYCWEVKEESRELSCTGKKISSQ